MITDEDHRKIGEAIYNQALSDRRGFRADQIGIDDKAIWNEIYDAIAAAALPLIRGAVVEECAKVAERQIFRLAPPDTKRQSEDLTLVQAVAREVARDIRALSPREAGE